MGEFNVGGGGQPPPPPPSGPLGAGTDREIARPSDVLGRVGEILLAGEPPGTTPVSAGKKVLQTIGVFSIKLAGEIPSVFFGGASKLNNTADQRNALSQISGGVVQEAAAAVVRATAVITPTWDADP